ncbi:MAG TPA: SpoIID/LytB domain-containing protein [Acidimicrobiales bacterium]|nr:SpoIID/LytB domain-containing protein [Acidimicrobiales bacterium]
MPSHRRTAPARRRTAALALVATLLTSLAALAGPPPPAAAYPAATVDLKGHGFGHGRGMGQYGALGYALAGSPYTSILDRYYGGTAAGSVGNVTTTVRISRLDGVDTVLTQEQGALTSDVFPGPYGAMLVRAAVGGLDVYTGPGCGGPWTKAGTVGGPVTIASTLTQGDDHRNMLQLCESTSTRWYRGDFQVVLDGGASRTVNRVDLENYLKGVVPRESPAAWGDLGGGAGMDALRAQSVAARSYAYTQNRQAYAKTCDTETCQVYGGVAKQEGGTYTALEDPRTTQAVADTAGQVRVFSGSGAVASTEFSSSTGGWTAGGTFPSVADDGDATPSNPNHDWKASVPVAAIQAAYPGVGALQSVDVAHRNGFGDLGGRVVDLVLVGTGGRQTVTGNDFRLKFGLKSDWFAVTNNAGGGVAGYWQVAADGGIFSFGAAQFYGSMGGRRLNQPVLDMAPTASGNGYWLVASDGGIFTFGDARFFGSTGSIRLNKPVVTMAATPTGNGYWLVASDGGIFSYGDARFAGSTGGMRLNKPVVGMAPTPSGNGYWLVASDGGIFAFGDAPFLGSTGAITLNQPVVGMAATPSGKGYWLLAADGGIFAYGDAAFLGSLPGLAAPGPARGIEGTRTGAGYLISNDAGRVFAFGDAPYLSDVAAAVPGYKGGIRGLAVRAVLTS